MASSPVPVRFGSSPCFFSIDFAIERITRKIARTASTLLVGGETGEGSLPAVENSGHATVRRMRSHEMLLNHLSRTPRVPWPGATLRVAARDAFARALIWPGRAWELAAGDAERSRRREPMVWEGGAYSLLSVVYACAGSHPVVVGGEKD